MPFFPFLLYLIGLLPCPPPAATVASTVIVVTPVVAIVDILKERHVLGYSSLPSSEFNKLDILLSLSALPCCYVAMVLGAWSDCGRGTLAHTWR